MGVHTLRLSRFKTKMHVYVCASPPIFNSFLPAASRTPQSKYTIFYPDDFLGNQTVWIYILQIQSSVIRLDCIKSLKIFNQSYINHLYFPLNREDYFLQQRIL